MTKFRKAALATLLGTSALCIGAFALTGCGSKDYTVTFMVQNEETGVWEQYKTVQTSDGSVTLPENPEKDNYVFRDWYDYSGSPTAFKTSGIESDKTVYAYFVPAEVTISINGEDGSKETLTNLETLTWEYTATALKSNLSFDGWYTDENYNVKYETGDDVTALYGRYRAHVTFDNGYETLYETDVTVGQTLTAPEATVETSSEGVATTFAQKYIVKNYMDEDSISYLDSDGTEIDFTQAVSGNMDITVSWQSPYLTFTKDTTSGTYYFSGLDRTYEDEIKEINAPVFSILSNNTIVGKTYDSDGNVTKITRGNVTGVYDAYGYFGSYLNDSVKKVIFGDGIEYIVGFNGRGSNCKVEEVSLPSTVKVLEASFNNMPRLKEFKIPSSVVSVISCFWAEYSTGANKQVPTSDATYDITIAIPDTVSNIDLLPKNVTFSSSSIFQRDETDNRIYQIDGTNKILVSDYQTNVGEDGVLEIPEGVTGVQVGVFTGLDYSILKFPSTMKTVGYNASTAICSSYAKATTSAYAGSWLYRADAISSISTKPLSKLYSGAQWYSVVADLADGGVERVIFNTTKRPSGFKDYSFVYSPNYSESTYYGDLDGQYVVFTAEIAEGTAVSVTVKASNYMTGENINISANKKLIKSGEKLTKEILIEALGLNSLTYTYAITSVTQFGEEYDFDKTVTCNLYIDLEFEYANYGITYEENSDGTLTVTGFDKASAQKLSDTNEYYLVNIPAEINDKKVVAIADNAFDGNEYISKVFIKNSVKTIGKYAFRYCSNLTYIDIEAGGLETIKEGAFYGVGCYKDTDGTDNHMAGDAVTIKVPLANLVSVEPYAFKSFGIEEFTAVDGEDNRMIMNYPWSTTFVNSDLVVGAYYWGTKTGYGSIYQLIKYTGKTQVEKDNEGGKETVDVYDVQLIAVAGGMKYGGGTFALGTSYRGYSSYYSVAATAVMRYEIMEGSVYYLGGHDKNGSISSVNEITFGIISKIHKNAFTDMDEKFITTRSDGTNRLSTYITTYDTWLTEADFLAQTYFEEGWWCGKTNSEMTEILKAHTNYSSSMLC